jgi:hypothetical protein
MKQAIVEARLGFVWIDGRREERIRNKRRGVRGEAIRIRKKGRTEGRKEQTNERRKRNEERRVVVVPCFLPSFLWLSDQQTDNEFMACLAVLLLPKPFLSLHLFPLPCSLFSGSAAAKRPLNGQKGAQASRLA